MSKAKGTRIEHKVKRRLEAAGYSVCRAGASLGAWDLIAIAASGVRLIQVKGGAKPYCCPAERETLELFPAPPHVSKELWLWTDYEREPVVKIL